MTAQNHTHDARSAVPAGLGMPDREIARTIGACRSLVQRRRTALGLRPVGHLGRRKKTAPKVEPAPTKVTRPAANPGGGVTKPTTQMDRFLAAFERSSYAKPEESERAKEAGRFGRIPSPPALWSGSSSLERC